MFASVFFIDIFIACTKPIASPDKEIIYSTRFRSVEIIGDDLTLAVIEKDEDIIGAINESIDNVVLAPTKVKRSVKFSNRFN